MGGKKTTEIKEKKDTKMVRKDKQGQNNKRKERWKDIRQTRKDKREKGHKED